MIWRPKTKAGNKIYCTSRILLDLGQINFSVGAWFWAHWGLGIEVSYQAKSLNFKLEILNLFFDITIYFERRTRKGEFPNKESALFKLRR